MVDAIDNFIEDVLTEPGTQALEDQADRVLSGDYRITLDDESRPVLIQAVRYIATEYRSRTQLQKTLANQSADNRILGSIAGRVRALLAALDHDLEHGEWLLRGGRMDAIRGIAEDAESLSDGLKTRGKGKPRSLRDPGFYLQIADLYEGYGGEVKAPYEDGDLDIQTDFSVFAADWLRVIDPDRTPPSNRSIRKIIDRR